MSEIKRYRPSNRYHEWHSGGGSPNVPCLEEDPAGEAVKYEDHAAELTRLRAEVERLRRVEEAAKRFVFHHDKSRCEQANASSPGLHIVQAAHWLSQLSAALTPQQPATGGGGG